MLRSSDVIKVNNMYLKHLFAMRSGFGPRHVHAGFVVNRIGTGQVPPPQLFQFTSVSINSQLLHSHVSFFCYWRYIILVLSIDRDAK